LHVDAYSHRPCGLAKQITNAEDHVDVFAGGRTICRVEQIQRRPTGWRNVRRSSCELVLKAAELVSLTRDFTAARARNDMQHCSVANIAVHQVDKMPSFIVGLV